MHQLHLIGRASALFDNLVLTWGDCPASFEASQLDSFPQAIERVYARRPDWIVYCGPAAVSSWDAGAIDCADDPPRVGELARAAAEVNARLAVVTSDRVFVGPTMFHDESEPAGCDEQALGFQAIEQAALPLDLDRRRVLIVRTNALGWSAAGESFAERVWRSLDQHKPIELDSASFATPILATDLAELLLRCFRARLHGILHIGGAERTSPFRFAQELAAAAGFDRRLVQAKPSAVADEEITSHPLETSLASRRLRHELDASLPLLRESVARFAEQAVNGYCDRLRGTPANGMSRAA